MTTVTAPSVHHDEVLTGEAVALDVQPVGLLMRALGAIIDVVTLVILTVLFVWAIVSMLDAGILDSSTAQIASIAMIVIVLIGVPAAVETLTKGRSLGKLAIGGRVVRYDGGAIGFRHAFIRALLGVLEIYMTVGSVALLVGIFTPRSQRLGDLVAGCYAERTRTRPLPQDPPQVPWNLQEWAAMADVARLPDRLGRRIAQFVDGADKMFPAARMRLATDLAAEVRPFVSPLPQVDPETLIRGVVAVRRDRELRSLTLQNERVARLLGPR